MLLHKLLEVLAFMLVIRIDIIAWGVGREQAAVACRGDGKRLVHGGIHILGEDYVAAVSPVRELCAYLPARIRNPD